MRKVKEMGVFQERLRQLVNEEKNENVEQHFTTADYGESIGKSRSSFEAYLNGKATPDYPTLLRIAKRFNVSIDYLLGNSDQKSPDANLKAASDYTGLSLAAVAILHKAKERIDYYMSVPLHTELHTVHEIGIGINRDNVVLKYMTDEGETRDEAKAKLEKEMATLDFFDMLILSSQREEIVRNYVKMKNSIGNGCSTAQFIHREECEEADKWDSAEFKNSQAFGHFYDEALSHSQNRWILIEDLHQRFNQAGVEQEPRMEDREEK